MRRWLRHSPSPAAHFLWVAADRARNWWRWHGPRGHVHELEAKIGRQEEDMTLLIETIARLSKCLDDHGLLKPQLRLAEDGDEPA